ncbi:enoyl-CoA hydratase/isomerase family protein [Frankia sp. CNm7]|uniref:Enoyl-CoA hydratase/isomerase family protein n=1 Tax=Frankia nepalensis TaxID=1836974 RepID=A0A937RM35_9ACTN|nr:enoyl-CoA hydratase/isomerase family protein [Frankia nepalensis]MBL7501189.1 enoyl-CoA hydratase/isomerase family protein [Frankia nepalensis]MBL7514206.1 enoyl-CoA hydratase/isomerase family protein [Frankia nepalensis]MBL7523069.1 enoyl-CoA hydratase/isomerase family protein [Frankia nepalensis]MBL7631405.1 enoyl-CoA hydratase/isomerase family protein [Frankia nepalensis]
MSVTSTWNTLDVSVDGRVAWVRFDRPHRRNGVTTEMAVEMYGALTQIAALDSVSVLVLTGNGDTFCPGADLRAAADDPEAGRALPDPEVYHSARLLREMPAVTLAAVNGACAGAGFAWASACDLRVAAASARFATAFIAVGLPGELGLAWTLPRSVGASRARELMFLSPKIDAQTAHEYGLVSQVWPAESFHAELDRLVAELAGRRPEAVRLMKQSLVEAEGLGLGDYITAESARYLALLTGDGADLVRARLSGRGAGLGRPGEPA